MNTFDEIEKLTDAIRKLNSKVYALEQLVQELLKREQPLGPIAEQEN